MEEKKRVVKLKMKKKLKKKILSTHNRLCKVCGVSFTPVKGNGKFVCSPSCREKAKSKNLRCVPECSDMGVEAEIVLSPKEKESFVAAMTIEIAKALDDLKKNMINIPDIFQNIDPKLLARFKRYHLENPHVWSKFKQYSHKMYSTGRKKYSARTIINIIRWEHDILTTGEVFKINNDHIALYARLMIYHFPEFDGFFEMRQMKAFGRKISGEESLRCLT